MEAQELERGELRENNLWICAALKCPSKAICPSGMFNIYPYFHYNHVYGICTILWYYLKNFRTSVFNVI